MEKFKNFMKKTLLSLGVFFTFPLITAQTVYAQSDPSTEISAIIERIVKIATQVGSGVLILFIVKDAFTLLSGSGDSYQTRNTIAKDVFLLIIAAIFLFKPDFILEAIKFIANV